MNRDDLITAKSFENMKMGENVLYGKPHIYREHMLGTLHLPTGRLVGMSPMDTNHDDSWYPTEKLLAGDAPSDILITGGAFEENATSVNTLHLHLTTAESVTFIMAPCFEDDGCGWQYSDPTVFDTDRFRSFVSYPRDAWDLESSTYLDETFGPVDYENISARYPEGYTGEQLDREHMAWMINRMREQAREFGPEIQANEHTIQYYFSRPDKYPIPADVVAAWERVRGPEVGFGRLYGPGLVLDVGNAQNCTNVYGFDEAGALADLWIISSYEVTAMILDAYYEDIRGE